MELLPDCNTASIHSVHQSNTAPGEYRGKHCDIKHSIIVTFRPFRPLFRPYSIWYSPNRKDWFSINSSSYSTQQVRRMMLYDIRRCNRLSQWRCIKALRSTACARDLVVVCFWHITFWAYMSNRLPSLIQPPVLNGIQTPEPFKIYDFLRFYPH